MPRSTSDSRDNAGQAINLVIAVPIATIAGLLIEADETHPSRSQTAFALTWGVMLTLCITGYTFGQSNHHVYLLDALRIQEPEALARDWFTTHTLQYHFLFTKLVLALQSIRLLHAGFFVLYLALVVAMHASWLSIVRNVGGGLRAYLVSVLIYHISGGGLGLGVYQFLQDGSFLPSNISAVAALGAVALWLDRRLWLAAICVSISGLFHVNYAAALVGFWGLLSLVSLRDGRPRNGREWANYLVATVVAMAPCVYQVAVAASGSFSQKAKMPLDEFVAVYVRLRHEHHHDPLHWPIALWLSFLWPIPIAFYSLRSMHDSIAVRRLTFIFVVVLAMQAFAVVFAGIWYVSDTLVQLSLFRFSMFAKLVSCIYAAIFFVRVVPKRGMIGVAIATIAALLVIIAARGYLPRSIPQPQLGLLVGSSILTALLAFCWWKPELRVVWRTALLAGLPFCLFFAARQQFGVFMPGEDDPDMVELATWARSSTPPGSLFLTPPQDAIFALAAHRSTVVGFKQVPQLSDELIEWKRRLDEVLDEDIVGLPRPLQRTLDAMADRYASLPGAHLLAVASEYDCDYLITMKPLEPALPYSRLEYVSPANRYYVYRR